MKKDPICNINFNMDELHDPGEKMIQVIGKFKKMHESALRQALVSGGSKAGKKEETALDILKKRYAKGEIGREEFEEKKKELL